MTENLKRSEAQTRSKALRIECHEIILDVREAVVPGTKTFTVNSHIRIEVREAITTFVDFLGESVSSVKVDGWDTDIQFDGARISLPQLSPGEHNLSITGQARYSTTGEGLHRFVDPEDNETYLYSQFEPADARRVFPNFEQPDLKTPFKISILAPQGWTVLSNGGEDHRTDVDPNSHGQACSCWSFGETKPMPTYLTAFICGPYAGFHDAIELDDQKVDLGFYCRTSLAPYFDLDDISTVTKQGLQAFPEAFDFEYPWGKYDSVFVPEYNLGAMENPGCVTFNEDAYIHRGLSTRAQRAGRANTILHEMSHMWFGDLTTPTWWDDLWLKESFAEFMGAWASAEATQYKEAWVNFAGQRVSWALQNDQYPTTHPIVADVPDLEAADQVFDGITYAKGAAALRQLVAWVGEEAFFNGARAYFKDHAFANASLDDLLDSLERASGRDLREWSAEWLQTAGVSTVRVERTDDGVRLTQEGTDPTTGERILRPHRLKVSGWIDGGGALSMAESVTIDLRDSVHIPWDDLGGADVDLVLPNDDALSYIKIAFDERSARAAIALDLDNDLSRSVVSSALWQMTRDGLMSAHNFARFTAAKPELDDSGLLSQRTLASVDALRRFTATDNRIASQDEFFAAALQAWEQSAPGSDQHTIWTRTLSRIGATLPARDSDIADVLDRTEDRDLRWMLLTTRAAHGGINQATLDAELEKSKSASDVVAHLEAAASLPGGRATTLQRILEGDISNDHISALISGFTHPAHSEEARKALPNYFEKISEVWSSHSQEIAERIIYGLYPFSDDDPNAHENADMAAATNWLNNHQDAPGALRKIILDCRDEHERMLRNQARDRESQ